MKLVIAGHALVCAALIAGCSSDQSSSPAASDDAGEPSQAGDAGVEPASDSAATPDPVDAAPPPPPDQDKDSVVDDADNCPAVPNTDQLDVDQDKIGDVCDASLPWTVMVNLVPVSPPAIPNVTVDDSIQNFAVDGTGVYLLAGSVVQKRTLGTGALAWELTGLTSATKKYLGMTVTSSHLVLTFSETTGIDEQLVIQGRALSTGAVEWEDIKNIARAQYRSCKPNCTNPEYFQERITSVHATDTTVYFYGGWEATFGFSLEGSFPVGPSPTVTVQGSLYKAAWTHVPTVDFQNRSNAMRGEVKDGAFTYAATVTDGVSDLVKKSGDTTVATLPWNPTLKKEYVQGVDQDADYVYYAAQVGDKNVDDVEIAMMRLQKSKF